MIYSPSGIFWILVFTVFPVFAEQKAAVVSSIKPSELREFESCSSQVKDIITYALDLTHKNLRYQYGSNDPKAGGMDCSGTVQHVLSRLGYDAPRQCNTLYLWVQKCGNLNEVSAPKSLSDKQFSRLQPGDLLFWEGTYKTGERIPPTSHVMIFLGHRASDGKPLMVGASSGRTYQGKSRHGVSVFDFLLPQSSSSTKFVGYGPVSGLKKSGSPSEKPQPAVAPVTKHSLRTEYKPQTSATPGIRNAHLTNPKTWGTGQHPAAARTTDGNTKEPWRYLVFLPANYQTSSEPFPLLLYLHGKSIRGHDLHQVSRYGPPAILNRKPNFPFVLVSPQLPEGAWPEQSLLAFLDEIQACFQIDPARIYLTGTSLGAAGAWNLAAAAPNRFAAMTVIGGYGDISLKKKLLNLPIWAFHGVKDDIVPIQPHRDLVNAINQAGGKARLTEYPEGNHGDIIMPVYQNDEVYAWYLTHKRLPEKKIASATTPARTTSQSSTMGVKSGNRNGLFKNLFKNRR